jgi:hypothetical protein
MGRPTTEAAQYQRLTLRLPPDLFEEVHRQATALGRPVNTHLVFVLREALGVAAPHQPGRPSEKRSKR